MKRRFFMLIMRAIDCISASIRSFPIDRYQRDRIVFVYEPDREITIFDEMDDRLPMPGFTLGLALTVGELFGWLVD
jgi:hypothetical protein